MDNVINKFIAYQILREITFHTGPVIVEFQYSRMAVVCYSYFLNLDYVIQDWAKDYNILLRQFANVVNSDE